MINRFIFSYDFIMVLSVLLCLLGICFISVSKALYRRQEKRYRDEQRDLLKWQMELEKRASELQDKKR
jgi:cbb3-type cytochrome oxidase subunit 3